MPPLTPPVRTPTQERSQKSLDRMLEAAELLIREQGFDSVTISDIVRRARTSVGSFYGRFEDKAALLRAVHDRALSRVEAGFQAQALELAHCHSLSEAVPKLVANYVELIAQDIALVRAFAMQGGADPAILARAVRMDSVHFKCFSEALRIHAAEIRHADPERAIRFAYRAYLAIGSSIGWGGSPAAHLSSAHIIEELSRTLLAYFECGASRAQPKRVTGTRRKR